AVLRRTLRRPRPDSDRLLARANPRRDDPVRHRAFAARRPGTLAQRPAGALQRRGSAGSSTGPGRPRARQRGYGRAVPPALRSRRRRGALPEVRADRAEGRVLLRLLSGVVLRVVLLPQELRAAGLSLAVARRRHRARARRDDPEIRRAHTRPPVVAGRAARIRAGHSHRRRLLLARARRQGARARRRLEPAPGVAFAPEAEDDRAPGAR